MIPGEIGLVVYHWDADGVASASMVLRDRRVHGLAVPRIGHYTAQAIPLGDAAQDLPILVLDYGLRQEELRRLRDEAGRSIVVVDHHLTDARSEEGVTVFNPSPGRTPSTTWVLRNLLPRPPVLPLLVGVAGDQGAEIRDPEARGEVERLLAEKGWGYGELLELAERLNSCAPLADYKCLLEAPRRLLGYGEDLDKALRDEEWKQAKERVEMELNRLLAGMEAEEREGILVYRASSNLYLASRLGRRLSAMNPGRTVVLVFRRSDGYVEIYVRRKPGGLSAPLKALQARGVPVGGKDTVFASQVPATMATRILEEILGVLEASMKGD